MAGLVVVSTLTPKLSPDRTPIMCNQEKAFVAAAMVGDILSELVGPSRAEIEPEKPRVTYRGNCIFHVAGPVRITDPTGRQTEKSFEGDIRLFPVPMVWKNLSVEIR